MKKSSNGKIPHKEVAVQTVELMVNKLTKNMMDIERVQLAAQILNDVDPEHEVMKEFFAKLNDTMHEYVCGFAADEEDRDS
jgi:hypothetical protein